MRDTIEMAREAGFNVKMFKPPVITAYHSNGSWVSVGDELKAFEALARADEREQGQKWFEAVTAQHKQEILAEREACAKLAQSTVCDTHIPTGVKIYGTVAAKAIRARGEQP
jgi:hypothetical protein